MNAKQLRDWKKREEFRTTELFRQKKSLYALNDVYPEFKFEKPYTTSLDGYLPLPLLLPFFKRVNVGIFPYLKNEKEFCDWYGIKPKELLELYESERVNLRLLYPHSLSVIPKYLNPFFELDLPTTLRDKSFTRTVLGDEKVDHLKSRFKNLFNLNRSTSIDPYKHNNSRANKSALSVYLQLHSFNYEEEIKGFENLATKSFEEAKAWLEICRLFKIGPHHYSMGGTHSVGSNVVSEHFFPAFKHTEFPSELGQILIDSHKLIDTDTNFSRFDWKEAAQLKFYENSELAHKLLYGLNELIEQNKLTIDKVEDIKALYSKTTKTEKLITKAFNIVAGVGITAVTSIMNPVAGLLTGIGFAVGTSAFPQVGETVGKELTKTSYRLQGKRSLALLMNKELKQLLKN